jgi:ribonuclease HI
MSKKKYYAYSMGKEQGITDNWPECQDIVARAANAKYKGFETREEAERWLSAGADYKIKHIAEDRGIYFDAGTGAGNGVEINVSDARGNGLLWNILPEKELNEKGHYPVPGATNNFGELLACKYALQIAMQSNIQKVFGDSALILDYWSKGYIKKDMNEETRETAAQVKKLRWQFEQNGGHLLKISGGSNPADLGFHRG